MPTQLTLNFNAQTPTLQAGQQDNWVDVTAIARPIGFVGQVKVTCALNDLLATKSIEIDDAYDQRLYDSIWLAYYRLSLCQSKTARFNFYFKRRYPNGEEAPEECLHLVVKSEPDVSLIGLLKDF